MRRVGEMHSRGLKWFHAILFLAILVMGIDSTQAGLTLGEKYDQTNFQEIQDLLSPALLNWVKQGEVVLQTGGLEFEWKKGDAFLNASLKNEGQYDIDQDGLLIAKNTGKPPEFVYGFAFPKIDPKDPKVAERIMENHAAQFFNRGSQIAISRSMLVSPGGRVEREITSGGSYLFYQQRPGGPIPNPDHVLFQRMFFVIEPFDLRGSNTMFWSYNDRREDTNVTYISAIRRVRRVSASDPSNPTLGSDTCQDDFFIWSGKNASMKWKVIGEQNLLVPFASVKKIEVKEFQDGSIDRAFIPVKIGLEVPGWKGAPWCPVNVTWSPRPCWIIEMIPKYSNYFYGKQILYVDKETYTAFFKEIYNKDGHYWKATFFSGTYQGTPTGRDLVGIAELILMVDDKTRHSTITRTIKHPIRDHRMHLPLSVLGPKDFTEDALIQLSK